MKMADSEKTEEFLDTECPPECLDEAQSLMGSVQGEQDEHLKTETTTSTSSPPREKEEDSPLNTEGEQSLLSMPCLMKELRRDSPESQHASTGSDKPVLRHIYESDSSNPCMLSPSSSGHLADSDTLSSGEEVAAPPVEGDDEGHMEAANDPGQVARRQTSATASGGRKSRRSRSESEMPPNAMAAKKNRCQPIVVAAAGQEKQTNGKLTKVKGHRSQKHKERMRLLRQKREAAARKKYNLLQDSSTSDSELTCDSSTSSSDDDDDDTSGGSKTIKTDIPDGPPVVGHYDISDTDSNQESMSVEKVRPTVIKHELNTHRGQDMAAHSGCVRALSSISGHVEAELLHKESSQHKGQINIASSDSEVEIVGVQEKARCAHPCGGVIKSLSSWKENSVEQFNSTNQSQLWTTVSPQPNWVSPPEVVDLTLDEDAGHKYLL
ncbi:protein ARK2N isoform 1-T2 [Odontesthes bonariensis]|uniref:protein ARK2N isoform X1 n=1 Tax=Odontesthes bonariensis TaxID=219752 RepID=UPI003F589F01